MTSKNSGTSLIELALSEPDALVRRVLAAERIGRKGAVEDRFHRDDDAESGSRITAFYGWSPRVIKALSAFEGRDAGRI